MKIDGFALEERLLSRTVCPKRMWFISQGFHGICMPGLFLVKFDRSLRPPTGTAVLLAHFDDRSESLPAQVSVFSVSEKSLFEIQVSNI